jgi:tetratricopeptide (TPR) repeat protein
LNERLCEGDTIRVGARSRIAVQLVNDAVLRVDQNTSLRLVNVTGETNDPSWLDLISGAFQSFSRKPWLLKVTTPHLKGDIDGTEFYVQAGVGRSRLSVLEGRVAVSNASGRVTISPGQEARAETGKVPERLTVADPRAAVRWGLYYPPILAIAGGRFDPASPDLPSALRAVPADPGRGRSTAFEALDRVPATDRDARYYLYRAALLLAVGRAPEAQADIERTLSLDAGAGLAYALRAIIHVVQNDRQQALADAERAVSSSPTAAARIALSYAQQADFRIEAARDTLSAAVTQHPEDPLAWARLAEIDLMLGDREAARAAADKAVSLLPDLARTQLVLGFAALAEFRDREAKAAFERAIGLDSAEPLAHLGLGLAEIGGGDLAAGRRDLEVAVGLDSNSALLRTYLGKAYFDEKRYPLDARQYDIAKSLDPADPTAYLYDAILKQTLNRPVEALRDHEASIARNDNRAVYRSRLLLDQDRATRGAALARAYRDLGFTQLAIHRSTESLAIDPANYSAHRFLSDTYTGVRRREIARVSELLQAQLLQDINIYPVQPSITETNLNIVTLGGPATAGYNEFTQLFERDRARVDVTGFAGSDDTYGGEALATVLHNRFSLSTGGFFYVSDGWRPNNDLTQQIYTLYPQWAISPELNVQAEFRHRESEEGDLAFNFDPNDFLPDKSVERDQDTARFGLRYSPTPRSSFLFSFIHSDRAVELNEVAPAFTENDGVREISPDAPISAIEARADDDGDQFEGQFLYRGSRYNLVLGLGYSEVRTRGDEIVSLFDPDRVLIDAFTVSSEDRTAHPRGYLYANINVPTPVVWTLGLGYDDYENIPQEATSINPKLGVQWQATRDLRLRGAAFKVLKPALINNRTIEPTQIAGFNQVFDDIDATESWRYGAGFDWRPRRDLSVGGEITWRALDEPVFTLVDDTEAVQIEDRDEQLHNLYLYWTPNARLGVTAEFIYDRYKSEQGIATDLDNLPIKVTTFSAPLGATYFDTSGFFAGLTGTFVHQDVQRSETATQGAGSDNFFLVDALVGYRLPSRVGLLTLGVENIFDTDFHFQDDSYREFRDEPSTGPYFPDRIFLVRLSLGF